MSEQPLPPNPATDDTSLDVANQSLADALRTSFRILKLAMVALVILFLVSGTFVVDQNEQAIVLRLGEPIGSVRNAGFHWAFPAPIDEVVKIPVYQSSTLAIDSHWLFLRDKEKGRPLSEIRRGGQGLDPIRDGALLTADKGLVHVQWWLRYRIDDLTRYVSQVSDTDVERAGQIITKVLENVAVHVVSGYTTEEVTRKRISDLRLEVKLAVNRVLEDLETGIVVESVEIPKSIPPVQTRLAFDQVITEENNKRTTIRDAEQRARELLNNTAGAAHVKLIERLDALDAARLASDTESAKRINAEIDEIIEHEATGRVGTLVRNAKGFRTSTVQRMRGDAEQYETLLAEYRASPELLLTRLWEETKSRLYANPNITKVYRPAGTQIRIRVGLDPKQRNRKERDAYLKNVLPEEPQELEIKIPGGPLTVP
ncbi:MAG: SPFH domain-containing protein [Phycisphaerae bacterium]